MQKFGKNCYITTKGDKKINSYTFSFKKSDVEKSELDVDKELMVKVEKKRIILEQRG